MSLEAFRYFDGRLHAEDVPVQRLAEEYGTPLYVYSQSHLRNQYRDLAEALSPVSPLICYSMKANPNRAVVRTFLDGGSGVDIVSGGELFRALAAGADPGKIVFAGVGKTRDEVLYALKQGILFFTVESEPEAKRISQCAAELGVTARVAFRLNPDVDPKTHTYISTGKKENKFGMDIRRTAAAYEMAAGLPNIEITGLHMHIGSQILTPDPFVEALRRASGLCAELRARHSTFRYIDIGGGIGIQYQPAQAPLGPEVYAKAVIPILKEMGLAVVIEPGRYLVGNSGILVCRVQYVKDNPVRKFIVTDAGMNDLIRPALYQAHHEIMAVSQTEETVLADLVGPVCESGDFFAQNRQLPAVREGDLIAVRSAGAYGFAMASTYNSRPRPAEVMVLGAESFIVRRRESWEDLVRDEEGGMACSREPTRR